MQGRDGANKNPDILIAGFTVLICLLMAPFLVGWAPQRSDKVPIINLVSTYLQVPLLCLFRKSKTIISIFGGICLAFIILAATPVGFPYKEREAPQRFYVAVSRIIII